MTLYNSSSCTVKIKNKTKKNVDKNIRRTGTEADSPKSKENIHQSDYKTMQDQRHRISGKT